MTRGLVGHCVLMAALVVASTGAGRSSDAAPAKPQPAAKPPAAAAPAADATAGAPAPLMQLGAGDSVTIQVYGQPDMGATVYVSDEGAIPVALAGPVQVEGLSPAQASLRIEKALRDGKFLVDPHVTLIVTQSRSQRVSVLGQVGTPGRYSIESNTSILDLLAQAGGVKEDGADVVYLLRSDKEGKETRYPINLKLMVGDRPAQTERLKGGDSVFVPRADQFYIYGEVAQPGKYKVEPGMTIVQAIARAGGVTLRGSDRRVEVKRHKPDGNYVTSKAKLGESVQPDDVIRVKESIF
jgi:polysaccharide export outer membrane protein